MTKTTRQQTTYTIGRLARRARVRADSIRFYEREGLLSPHTKTASGYRLYTDAALRRLMFIKHAQRCGLSLAEIAKLLQLHESAPAAKRATYGLMAQKKREIDETIAVLKAMSNALDSVLPTVASVDERADDGTADESPVVAALEASLARQESSPGIARQTGNGRERPFSSLYR